MNIFKKRPLCLILCIMLGAFSLFSATSALTSYILLGAALLFLISVLCFIKRPFRARTLTIIATVAFLVSGTLGSLYFYLFFPKQYGEIITVRALVTECETEDYSSRLTLECQSINGDSCRYKLLWHRSANEVETLPAVGDIIEARCTLLPLESTESFDGRSYYVGKGYSAETDEVESLEILSTGNRTLSIWLADVRHTAAERFEALAEKNTAGLFCALILGEREALNPSLSLDFSRIGVSHILALSGMHLAILSGALMQLLSFFGLNKKIRTLISVIFTLLYVLLVGMPESVMRAGIMLIISSVLFLLSSSRDSLTSLSIAVFIIILFEPYAIYDLSLLLSAFATLGVVTFAEYRSRQGGSTRNVLIRLLTYILNATLTSVFAIAATLVICATRFSHFSSLGAISTLILSVIIEPFVYLGIILFAFGGFIPLGSVAESYYGIIKTVANWLSSFRYAAIPFDLPLMTVLVLLFTALFFAFLVLPIKRKRVYLGVLLTFYLSVSLYGASYSAAVAGSDGIYYTSDKTADVIVIKDEGELTAVYSGSNSRAGANTAEAVIYAERLSYLDNLIISNYSGGSDIFVEKLVSRLRCEVIYLPIPKTGYELAEAEKIADILSESSAGLSFYDTEQALHFGKYTFFNIYHSPYTDSSETKNILALLIGDRLCTYVSRGYIEGALTPHPALLAADTLVIGSHGARLNDNYSFNIKINSVNSIYFGADLKIDEPTKEFYNKKGASVIPTDARIRLD
ncbi:MAG: ComEC/Rec2 family competence protein [Clostridia bacterium]|nr:ComEC/Rec2 family competence protein [Clostridia bacterium]